MRITLGPCEKKRVAIYGLAPGERFKVQMVTLGFCGAVEGFTDYIPSGCPEHIGEPLRNRPAVNPMTLEGPGNFELIPDGVVSSQYKIDVSEGYRSCG